jgi:tetratricopeptide (TPR) repeat protein
MIRALMFAGGLVALLTACGDDFTAVQKADTIEAYEAYLEANPDSRWTLQAEGRLEGLYLEKARAEDSLEAYDAYLERFPKGTLRAKAFEEREEFLFDWARGEDTQASWQTFLDEYPKGDKKRRKQAERMIEVHEYLDKVTLSDTRVEQVNMAEDPKGPKDGWGFAVDVTNNGDESITDMRLVIQYLSPEGGVLREKEWPVVAPKFPIPMEEEKLVPIAPGETRTWWWTDGVIPERWLEEKKTRIKVTRISRAKPE